MNTYNLLSNKIPAQILEIIAAFQQILGDQAYDFLLIGASARDLIMDGIYELGISRLTNDVDFALYVPEWNDYDQVFEKLIASRQFTATRITHKLIFKEAYEIDIVPFGNIQNEQGQYTWPPDHIKAMNVAGFIEISEAGLEINSGSLHFRVASIPGICVMKLLAWHDRGRGDNRDGKDLGFILANYIDLKYEDLYGLHEDLMTDDNFDRFVTTARIMGRDIYELLKTNAAALEQIKQILVTETEDEEYSRLALCIKEGGGLSYPLAYRSLVALLKGLGDRDNS
jgi:predicted nucleotidyltransferase